MKPSVLGIIPVRAGSKGVPDKNIRELNGRPVVAYAIDAARLSTRLASFLVTTDSEAIADICRKAGADVPGLRPAELAGDASRVQDAVRHVLDNWAAPADFDYLMLLQSTTPFRTAQDIDDAIALAESHDATSVATYTVEETHHPYYMYEIEDGTPPRVKPLFTYPLGTPRQDFPRVVYRNGAVYLVKTSFFLEHGSLISDDVVPMIMPAERSINLDAEGDFRYAEFLIQSGVVKP